MTSYAKHLHSDFSDSQIQSLFHNLKSNAPNETSTKEEYQSFIESQIVAVRNSEISDRNKESVIARLEESNRTFDGMSPDNIYAAKNIVGQAGASQMVLANLSSTIATDLGANPDFIRHKINVWRDAKPDSYEDIINTPPKFRYDELEGVPKDYNTQRALRKLGYEHFLTKPYPVFVYGTLRSGQGNFGIFGDNYYDMSQGEIEGLALYGAERPFPYAKEASNGLGKAFGDILWIDETPAGRQVRYSLDSLEGFDSNFPSDSHYERKLKMVKFKNYKNEIEERPAWVYVASGSYKTQLREQERIESGDWVLARDKYLNSPLGRKERTLWADDSESR